MGEKGVDRRRSPKKDAKWVFETEARKQRPSSSGYPRYVQIGAMFQITSMCQAVLFGEGYS